MSAVAQEAKGRRDRPRMDHKDGGLRFRLRSASGQVVNPPAELVRVPGALAEGQGFGAPHLEHHDGAGGDADEGQHDGEGDFHRACINDLRANLCPVSIRIRSVNCRWEPPVTCL